MRTRAHAADHVHEQDEHDEQLRATRRLRAQNSVRLHELECQEHHVQPGADDLRAGRILAPSPAREFNFLPVEEIDGVGLDSDHGRLTEGL
jgi:hypothetical protein